jgi:hypothetical protein
MGVCMFVKLRIARCMRALLNGRMYMYRNCIEILFENAARQSCAVYCSFVRQCNHSLYSLLTMQCARGSNSKSLLNNMKIRRHYL